jgi:ParB family chromosome partitioning protein
LSQLETKPKVGRPESGQRRAARELGIDKSEVNRAIKIASITPEAKEAAKAAGIDDTQGDLLKLADQPAGEQVKAVAKIVAEKASNRTRKSATSATSDSHAKQVDQLRKHFFAVSDPAGQDFLKGLGFAILFDALVGAAGEKCVIEAALERLSREERKALLRSITRDAAPEKAKVAQQINSEQPAVRPDKSPEGARD